MARRRNAIKRETAPDPLFESKVVAALVNTVMSGGKKSTAQRVVYGAIKLANGDKVDSFVWIPFELVTPANMADYAAKN